MSCTQVRGIVRDLNTFTTLTQPLYVIHTYILLETVIYMIHFEEIVNKKLRDIIVYFTFKMKYLTLIRLIKLIYIAEIYSIEKFGRRLTEVDFLNYHYGPWSSEIDSTGEILSGDDILIEFDRTPQGYDASFFKPNVDKTAINLSEEDISILDNVIKEWGLKKTGNIIRFVKSTPLYKNSGFGELINFDEYIEECRSVLVESDNKILSGVHEAIEEYKKGLGKTFETKDKLLKHLQSL
ncbi:MAG: hypothetical protein LAKADJCE_00626 [Candidatus Argoarchaeum ethanivorans]|uniref:Antitoxin SocA-like Panacea domain-containing protein n=1 Tax=Candidatus Argoarchaeum ethanivorans TaxID=2608793 RepID=A0A811TE86_9EURY|nr:MAG: hypothetical protein LAKADJCE_00626 [Candidatus Argoarchaeum ethanivorans]